MENINVLTIRYINDNINQLINIPADTKLKYHKLEDFNESQYDNLISKIYNLKKNCILLKYLITIGIKYHNVKNDYIFLLPIKMFGDFIHFIDNIKVKYLFHKYKIDNAHKFDNICTYLAWIDPIYYLNKINLCQKMGFETIDDLIIYLYNFTYDIFSSNAYKYIKDDDLKKILVYICPFIYEDRGIIKIKNHKYKYLLPFNNELKMLSDNVYTRLVIFVANGGKCNIPELIKYKDEIIRDYINMVNRFSNFVILQSINKWMENKTDIINNKIIKTMMTGRLQNETIKMIFDSLDIYMIYNYYKENYEKCLPENHNIILSNLFENNIYDLEEQVTFAYDYLSNDVKKCFFDNKY